MEGTAESANQQVLQALEGLVGAPSGERLGALCSSLRHQLGARGVVVSVRSDDADPWLTAGDGGKLCALAEEQFSLREGPCLDARACSEPVWARVSTAQARWPRWAPRAVALGVDGVLSVPVHAADRRLLGTVWVAFSEPQWIEDRALRSASAAATIALRHLTTHRELVARRQEVGQLEHALQSRIVIEQAKGFLAAREGLSVDKTFNLLRAVARSGQRRVHDVAREVLQEGGLPQADAARDGRRRA